MTENEYIRRLEAELGGLPENEVAEILRDTREHFAAARAGGRKDEEIAEGLGDPRLVAKEYLADALVARFRGERKLGRQSLLLFGLLKLVFIVAPMNFFLLVGPVLALAITWAVFWVLAIAFPVASLAAIGVYFYYPPQTPVDIWTDITVVTGCLSFFFTWVSLALLLVKATEWLLRAAASYVRWNIRFVREA